MTGVQTCALPIYVVAYLDTAYTEKTENDYSALTVWGVYTEDPVSVNVRTDDGRLSLKQFDRIQKQPHPKAMLVYAWQERLELHKLVNKVIETQKLCKFETILIENKAAGIPVASELRRLYTGNGIQVVLDDPKSLDKVARLYSVQGLFTNDMVYAPNKSWADDVIVQCMRFPKAKHDDLVDTVSGGLRYLRRTGLLRTPDEMQSEYEASIRHTGKPPPPLYAV